MTRAIEVDAVRDATPIGIDDRERIKQLLQAYYGITAIPLLTEAAVARKLGVDRFFVAKIRKRGIVKPRRFGRWLYSTQEIEEVKRYIKEHCVCPMCGGAKKATSRACPSCWQRHRWLLADEEGREKINQTNRSWQERNPDRHREIQRNAHRKWRSKKSREYFEGGRDYLVIKRCQFPIGDIIKVYGWQDHKAVLEDGSLLPLVCIRRVASAA